MATNTTATATTHTGNGSTNNFAISFSFLANNEVDVTVAGVLKTLDTHYTISGSTVTFTSGNTPANGAAVKFQRDTNISAKKVDFQDGSVLTETDLDTNSDQVLFAQQEITDKLGGIEEGATGDQTAAEIRTLVESATDSNVFTDADHTKLNGIETAATADQTASEIRTLVESASDSNVFTDADHTKLNGIEANATADQTAAEIRTLVESASDSNVFTDADHSKLNAIEAGATADQTVSEIKSLIAGSPLDASHLAANSVDSSELVDGSIDTSHLSADCVDSTKIADNAIGSEHLQANSVGTSEIADAELTTLAGMQSGTASKLADSTALTADLADLNQLDGMAKQTTITDDDTKFPTSGAVVDFVAAQIAPIGGLEVIANEDSFPTTQPASGVVISISDIEGLIVNGSGVATNARTSGNGSDNVTINGFPSSLQSKTMAAGLGLMVSSTGSSQTYTYHKLLAKEADVEQLSNDINDFAARYRVGSTNPTTDLDAGDLFFNTSTSKLLVYNATNSAWEEAQSIGNFFISTLSPAFDGSTQDFTITNAPSSAEQIILSINGVVQKPNSGTSTPSEGFALSGSTVKLAAAPATGSDYFAVVIGSTVNIGTPSNNTVTTAILQNGSVTTAKIGDDQITAAKISNNEDFNINSVTVGKGANSVAGNTVLGESALDASVSGGNNTAIGKEALTALTSGANNVAVGSATLDANTTGGNNVAVGEGALSANTTASNNSAVGRYALNENVTGIENTAMGLSALRVNTASYNTAFGKSALELNTSGNPNEAFGAYTLDANTTGANNVAVGYAALTANTTASNNVALGNNTLAANTTGANNTGLGHQTLKTNTTASNNTAAGYFALYANTTGTQNTAVGTTALDANTTGNNNHAVGYDALGLNTTGSSNCAFGTHAMRDNTTASNNTAYGHTALKQNTTGHSNVAVGAFALDANTTASQNTAVGYEALKLNTTGYSHTAVGHGALDTSTTSYDCCAFGVDSLRSQTTGVNNSAFGKDTLANLTTGNHNTAIGKNAGNNVTTGGSNVFVGMNAGNGQVTTESDYLFIAREGVAAGNDGCWIFGDAEGDVFQGNNDSHWATLSDQRLKKDIVDNTKGLEVIDQVKVKNFKFKQYKDGSPVTSDDTVDISAFTNDPKINQVLLRQGDTSTKIGVVAQELETVLPNSVKTGPHGQKTVLQDELFWHMLNAIKELSTRVTALEAG